MLRSEVSVSDMWLSLNLQSEHLLEVKWRLLLFAFSLQLETAMAFLLKASYRLCGLLVLTLFPSFVAVVLPFQYVSADLSLCSLENK